LNGEYDKNYLYTSQVTQKPGEFVVTAAMAYHQVFNTGTNLAEACNIVTEQFYPCGLRFIKCQCKLRVVTDEKTGKKKQEYDPPNIPKVLFAICYLKKEELVAYLKGLLMGKHPVTGKDELYPMPGSLDLKAAYLPGRNVGKTNKTVVKRFNEIMSWQTTVSNDEY
jgi:hypothetical protein